MSEEWDEVKNEVKLMMSMLAAFHDDLEAARNSGGLTERQVKAADLMMGQALGAGILLDVYVKESGSVEAVEEGGE